MINGLDRAVGRVTGAAGFIGRHVVPAVAPALASALWGLLDYELVWAGLRKTAQDDRPYRIDGLRQDRCKRALQCASPT